MRSAGSPWADSSRAHAFRKAYPGRRRRSVARTLAQSHGIPRSQVNAMLTGMIKEITKHLKKGKRIRIGGLGILQVRKRPARMGRNPATGEAMKIKASKKIAFRAAKDLKEAV